MYEERLLEDLPFPDSNAIERVGKYVLLLSPIEKISRFFEGQKYQTIAHVPQILKIMMTELSCVHQELQIVATLRQHLADEINSRFGNILTTVNAALLAAAVHPVHGHLSFISEELRNCVWEKLKEWSDTVYDCGNTMDPTQTFLNQQRHLILNFLRSKFESHEHQHLWPLKFQYGQEVDLENEKKWSDYYVADEENEKIFIMIQKLVKMVMSLPCTSAPAERVFSCSGFLKPPLRNRLAPHLLEYLTVIRSFIHSPLYDFAQLLQIFSDLISA